MPRFYLHLMNDPDIRDHEGVDLADVQAARDLAWRSIAELVADDLARGQPIVMHHAIAIEDADHRQVSEVKFGDVLQIVP